MRKVHFVWGCWLFGFGAPVPYLWVLALGPLRLTFNSWNAPWRAEKE